MTRLAVLPSKSGRALYADIEFERAHAVLAYDAVTGVFTWNANLGSRARRGQQAGALRPDGYRLIGVDGRHVLAHRLAWFMTHQEWPVLIDHIDGQRDNNALRNLRVASDHQNSTNSARRSDNTSGYKGVCWHKTNRLWRARISKSGKHVMLDYFKTAEEAYTAYCTAANQAYGSFARLS